MIIVLQALIYFRQSLLAVLRNIIGPYYRKFTPPDRGDDDDSDSEVEVFADFDEEKGVVFFPPLYAQRYAAVIDCLMDERWCGRIEKVVDLGYHDLNFIKYLKDVPGITSILGVDIEAIPLNCFAHVLSEGNSTKRENPMKITLYQGNAADPDYRLIGCDAVIAIEMIEHMLPHDLEKLIHTVFGFIKPQIAIFTTPNGDFNPLFKALEENGLRRLDHFFEWSRSQFHDWCSNIVRRYPDYTVNCKGIGPGPPSTEYLGCCSQMALFTSKDYHKQKDLNPNSLVLVSDAPSSGGVTDVDTVNSEDSIDDNKMLCLPHKLSCTDFHVRNFSKTTQDLMKKNQTDYLTHTRQVVGEIKDLTEMLNMNKNFSHKELEYGSNIWYNTNWGENAPYWNQYYKLVKEFRLPFDDPSDENCMIDLITDKISSLMDMYYDDSSIKVRNVEIPLADIMSIVGHITSDKEKVKELLEWNGYEVVDDVIIYSRLVDDENEMEQNLEGTNVICIDNRQNDLY